MKIWVNTIVNNEENFIWFSLMSVVDYVDKILVWDTGSTDKTVQIIREIIKNKKEKISFKQVGKTNKENFPRLRQKMLDESKSDWILILDGDEIWWKKSIEEIVKRIKKNGDKIDGIVVPMYVPVGDIYHMQDSNAGEYKLLGMTGHLSLRLINKKIPGLHVDWPYGKESFFDSENKLIQQRKKITFINKPYLHVTHLKRSDQKRQNDKFKYELGKLVSKDFKYPEVFYEDYPDMVSNPWIKISGLPLIKSRIFEPFRRIKRKIIK